MASELTEDDWLEAYRAWEVMHQLVNANGLAQTVEAMQSITPDVMDGLLGVVNKLRGLHGSPALPAVAVRELRFPVSHKPYSYVMHLAAYRYMRDDEERMMRGETNRPSVLYDQNHTFGLIHLAEEYRWAYTHMCRGYGCEHRQYANPVIQYLVEFSPSDRELDMAAEYYRYKLVEEC